MFYTIAIADDHNLIAKALAGIIENFKRYQVLYEVENGKALIEKCGQSRNVPDILLLDINMPVMDGFETALWMSQNHPEVKILALSMQDDEDVLVKMIRSGASGYLLKNAHPADLEKALDAMIEKGFYYPDWATGKLLRSIANGDKDAMESIVLNKRQIEFLQYAVTELSYKEIAEKMFCSPRTVESYRDTLFEKLGLKTRVGLVVFALRNKIVKL